MNYFNEKNKDNTMYWQREDEVRKIVKKIVTAKRVGKTIIDLEKLYEEVVQEMVQLQYNFKNEYTGIENKDYSKKIR